MTQHTDKSGRYANSGSRSSPKTTVFTDIPNNEFHSSRKEKKNTSLCVRASIQSISIQLEHFACDILLIYCLLNNTNWLQINRQKSTQIESIDYSDVVVMFFYGRCDGETWRPFFVTQTCNPFHMIGINFGMAHFHSCTNAIFRIHTEIDVLITDSLLLTPCLYTILLHESLFIGENFYYLYTKSDTSILRVSLFRNVNETSLTAFTLLCWSCWMAYGNTYGKNKKKYSGMEWVMIWCIWNHGYWVNK